jgi:CHASE3 domain sensor protein
MSKAYDPNSFDAILSRIESNQGTMMASMAKIENALCEQNRRVIILESAENKRTGALIAIGTVCSVLGGAVAVAVDFFKGK